MHPGGAGGGRAAYLVCRTSTRTRQLRGVVSVEIESSDWQSSIDLPWLEKTRVAAKTAKMAKIERDLATPPSFGPKVETGVRGIDPRFVPVRAVFSIATFTAVCADGADGDLEIVGGGGGNVTPAYVAGGETACSTAACDLPGTPASLPRGCGGGDNDESGAALVVSWAMSTAASGGGSPGGRTEKGQEEGRVETSDPSTSVQACARFREVRISCRRCAAEDALQEVATPRSTADDASFTGTPSCLVLRNVSVTPVLIVSRNNQQRQSQDQPKQPVVVKGGSSTSPASSPREVSGGKAAQNNLRRPRSLKPNDNNGSNDGRGSGGRRTTRQKYIVDDDSKENEASPRRRVSPRSRSPPPLPPRVTVKINQRLPSNYGCADEASPGVSPRTRSPPPLPPRPRTPPRSSPSLHENGTIPPRMLHERKAPAEEQAETHGVEEKNSSDGSPIEVKVTQVKLEVNSVEGTVDASLARWLNIRGKWDAEDAAAAERRAARFIKGESISIAARFVISCLFFCEKTL